MSRGSADGRGEKRLAVRLEERGGGVSRGGGRLRPPRARWAGLTLIVLGFVAAFVAMAGTHWMVAAPGTDTFCGGACHSMQWVAQEHRESAHGMNAAGVHAG